jgi:hypothetical protein
MNTISKVSAEYMLTQATKSLRRLEAAKAMVSIGAPLTGDQYRQIAEAYYSAESLHRWLISAFTDEATADPVFLPLAAE